MSSIEQQIANLQAALEANTAAIKASSAAVLANEKVKNDCVAHPKEEKAPAAPKVDKKPEAPKTEKKPATEAPKTEAPKTAPAGDMPAEYQPVYVATIEAAKKHGRDYVAKALSKFGTHENARTLNPADYAAYIKELKGDEDLA